MLKNILQAEELHKKYSIPPEDILLISLNLLGVRANITDKRIRFKFKLNNCEEIFYLAICVNTGRTPFSLKENKIFFNDKTIGIVIDLERDTCDSTYFRRNKTALTLNSNSRSRCRGCKFCGTYNQEAEDRYNLTTPERLREHIKKLLYQNQFKDLSKIIDVGICTGCFFSEKHTLDHILMVKNVFKDFGFNKEIKYLGSQITSEESLKKLKKETDAFSLYFTLECFTRRKELLRHHKADIDLLLAQRVLTNAKNNGFGTTILYILGLDSIGAIIDEFKRFLPCLTRFPIINLYQNYELKHESLRNQEAKNIEYYLQARKDIEDIFKNTGLRPRPWENYRGLWYLSFAEEKINDIRI